MLLRDGKKISDVNNDDISKCSESHMSIGIITLIDLIEAILKVDVHDEKDRDKAVKLH